MKLKIKVTKDIISKAMWCGTHDSDVWISQNCAIALAVRDIFPEASVTARYLRPWIGGPMIVHYQRDFILTFDRLRTNPEKRLLLPGFQFEIDLPSDVIDEINISDIHKSPTLEVVS